MADDILRNKVFIVYFRVIHQSIVLIISCSTWQRISHRSDWIDEWNSCKKSSQLIRLDGSIDQLNQIVCLDSSKTQNSSNVQAHPSQRLTKRKVLFSKSPEKQKEPEWTVCVFQAERAPETPIQFIFVHEKGLLHNLNYIDICFKLNQTWPRLLKMSADLPHPDPGGGGGGLHYGGGGWGQGRGQPRAQQPRLYSLDLAPGAPRGPDIGGGQHPAPHVHKHQGVVLRVRDPGPGSNVVTDLPQTSEHVMRFRNRVEGTSDDFSGAQSRGGGGDHFSVRIQEWYFPPCGWREAHWGVFVFRIRICVSNISGDSLDTLDTFKIRKLFAPRTWTHGSCPILNI